MLPSQIRSVAASARRGRRGRVIQDAAAGVDRLEGSEDRRVVQVVVQQRTESLDPVVRRRIHEVHPEDVLEDRVVRRADRVHVAEQQDAAMTEAPWDVRVAARVGVEPEWVEHEPGVVRREGSHASPLEAARQGQVEPGVPGGDLEVAVEHACLLSQESCRPGPSSPRPCPAPQVGERLPLDLAASSSAAINARAWRSSGTLCAFNRRGYGDPTEGKLCPMARGACLRVMSAHRSPDLRVCSGAETLGRLS